MKYQIEKILDDLGITQSQFSKEINVSKGNISDLLKGRTKSLSADAITNIYRKYNINPTWLLTGEGEMYLTKPTNNNIPNINARGDVNIITHSFNTSSPEKKSRLKQIQTILDAVEKDPELVDLILPIVKRFSKE